VGRGEGETEGRDDDGSHKISMPPSRPVPRQRACPYLDGPQDLKGRCLLLLGAGLQAEMELADQIAEADPHGLPPPPLLPHHARRRPCPRPPVRVIARVYCELRH